MTLNCSMLVDMSLSCDRLVYLSSHPVHAGICSSPEEDKKVQKIDGFFFNNMYNLGASAQSTVTLSVSYYEQLQQPMS